MKWPTKKTLVSMRHRAKYRADESFHCPYMVIHRFFKMAAIHHLVFSKFAIFNGQ